MTVRADTTHKEVHATSLSNHLLIMGTFGQKVGSIAVEDMDILGFDVDVVEEIVPHKAVVALGVVYIEADILVHVECDHILETDDTLLIQFNQMLVEAEGRAARGAAQDEWLLGCRFSI